VTARIHEAAIEKELRYSRNIKSFEKLRSPVRLYLVRSLRIKHKSAVLQVVVVKTNTDDFNFLRLKAKDIKFIKTI
jgi:hypothetical protein